MSTAALDATHDPAARSWVSSANAPQADFPLQNLPFGVFRREGSGEAWRGGVAIGDSILDLQALLGAGLALPYAGVAPLAAGTPQDAGVAVPLADGLAERALRAAAQSSLNEFMALGEPYWHALRMTLFALLREGAAERETVARCLVPQAQAQMSVPARIGDFTDFYASIHHATAVGRLFRPDNPLLPNYTWVPIGYHGRSSSIGVSGQQFHRPLGQRLPPGQSAPALLPSARMDYELELGVFVGPGNAAGERIPLDEAGAHIFGLCLLNDWSARDIQAWEYQPLGPFLAKNFATTISPWIITAEALAPFRVPHERMPDAPAPLEYLDSEHNRGAGALDVQIEAWISTAAMRARGDAPRRLSHSSFRHSYWTVAQMLAHHSINGCNLQPGDLLGTGTQSGPAPEEAGSLLELTRGGKQPLALPGGEQRTFLEDGDEIELRAWCEAPGRRRIGFGSVTGRLLPART